MAEEMKGRVVGGEGKEAEIDGGYFGGYVKPANLKEDRIDRRFARNQNGKRRVVVIIRERGGNSVPAVFHSEGQASAFIRARIAKGTVVHADEAASWDNLHERFEVKRINHQEAYSLDGACTNWAEEYFSRLRRAEVGIHHHIAGAYLLRYAQESSWREDNRYWSRFGTSRLLLIGCSALRLRHLCKLSTMLRSTSLQLAIKINAEHRRPRLVAEFRDHHGLVLGFDLAGARQALQRGNDICDGAAVA